MKHLPTMKDAFLLIEKNRIADFGNMVDCPQRADLIIDASDKFVLPAWCDSHSHLVFAGTREQEFVDRINGLSYQEIAKKGGGILNSARKLQGIDFEELLEMAYQRLEEVQNFGTGAIEIKSGYGLTLESEIKILKVIQRLKEISPLQIKSTFLGAHALPLEYKNDRQGYIKLIIDQMLPEIAAGGLADYIDVFCEKVAFSIKETEQIIDAGLKYGLKPKIHTNQFNSMGGIELSVEKKAISVDHLEVMTDEEIFCLKGSDTIATLLPTAPFFLNDPYPNARKMLEEDLVVALATDYNPGSTPSGKMPFVLSLACIKMKMTPNEAINAATLNGAFAMEVQQKVGSIEKDKIANLIITKKIPSIEYIPYAFGSDFVYKVILDGKVVFTA